MTYDDVVVRSGRAQPVRVGIYAPDAGGHRLVYARLLVDAVSERGATPVLLTLQAVISSDEFEAHFGGMSVEIALVSQPPGGLTDLGSWALDMSLHRLIVPDGDGFLLDLASRRWVFPLSLTVLINRDPMLGPWIPLSAQVVSRLVKVAALALARRSRDGVRIMVLGSPMAAPTAGMVPDPVVVDVPVEGILAAVRALRSTFPSPDAYYVGLLGAISDRKCPLVVMEAVERASESVGPLGLAMIGPGSGEWLAQEPAMSERLASAGVHYHRVDRVLTNRELNQAVGAVDAVMLAYTTHVPNSTAAKARALGTRVLGAGSRDFCRYIESCGGSTVRSLTADMISTLIIDAFPLARPEPQSDDSVERFIRALLV